MATALIPVKSLHTAKSRLARVLDEQTRRALVLAMLEAVVTKCLSCHRISEVCVITSDPLIAATAERLGAITIQEPKDAGLNAAVSSGLETIRDFEASQILILPADIPFLDRLELAQIFDAFDACRQSVLVPCHRRMGTNAVLIPAQAAFRPQFGDGSFWRHFAQLSALGLEPRTLSLAGIAADIDEPEDLALLPDMAAQQQAMTLLPDRSAPCPRY